MFGSLINQDQSTYYVDRPRLGCLVRRKLRSSNLLLVKAPPLTGKTSFGRSLSVDANVRVFYKEVLYLDCKAISPGIGLYEQFLRMSNNHFDLRALLDDRTKQTSENAILVVLDNVEYIYVYSGCHADCREFWTIIKDRYQMSNNGGSKEGMLDVVLLATYEDKLHFSLNNWAIRAQDTITFDSLAFSDSEFTQLFQQFGCSTDSGGEKLSKKFNLTAEFRSAVWVLTRGHVGLSRLLLRHIFTHFLRRGLTQTFPVSSTLLLTYLDHKNVCHEVMHSRLVCLDWKDPTQNHLLYCVHDLLSERNIGVMVQHMMAIDKLQRLGVIAQSALTLRWSFPAPMLKTAVFNEYNSLMELQTAPSNQEIVLDV